MKSKLPSKINFLKETNTNFSDWNIIIPDSIEYYGPFNEYIRPIYYHKADELIKEEVKIRLGNNDCQFCGWQKLSNIWRIETNTKWSVVGSECWKGFSSEFRESKNVIRDVAYKKIIDVFLKHRDSLLDNYRNYSDNVGFKSSRRIYGYYYSSRLRQLTLTSTPSHLKKMIDGLSKIDIRYQLNDEVKNILRIIPQKGLRQIWI